MNIYAASEAPIVGINSERLVEDINQLHPGLAEIIDSTEKMEKIIRGQMENDLVLITFGAGAIGKNIRTLVEKLK